MDSTEIVTHRRAVGPPPLLLRLAAVLAVPLVLYALVATGQKALDNYRLNRDADALRAEVVALRQQNIQLQHEIEAARTDAAIEKIAREQLGLVKPGDKPVVLTGDAPALSGSTAPSAAAPAPPVPAPAVGAAAPVWRQWWQTFFG